MDYHSCIFIIAILQEIKTSRKSQSQLNDLQRYIFFLNSFLFALLKSSKLF